MDFEKEIENCLFFQFDNVDDRTDNGKKHKSMLKSAKSSLKKMVKDRLGGRGADC